jgi:hypothetical protein
MFFPALSSESRLHMATLPSDCYPDPVTLWVGGYTRDDKVMVY